MRPAPPATPGSNGSPNRYLVAAGSTVGTTIENYDFTAFGVASAAYFGPVFFPGSDPTAGTLLAFATLGAGFAVRPLGGFLGGHLGDRIGRKPVLLMSLLVMGGATFLIGLLPTYAQVGIWAPVLLTAVRLLQGLAFGAEWGGAIMMTYEHAPAHRKAFYTSIPQAGIPLGLLLANLVFLSVAGWDSQLAWRLPFLASGVLVVAGLFIRLRVAESPDFERLRDAGGLDRRPLVTVVREQWRDILRVIGMRISQAAGFYVVVSYFLSYVTSEKLADRTTGFVAIVVAAALGVLLTPAYGRLSDAIGRKPLTLFGTAGLVVFAFPAFLLLNTGNAVLVVLVFVLGLSVFHDTMNSVQGAWYSELFRTATRTSGASIGYQVSAALSGFVPFIAVAVARAHGWVGVAWVYLLVGAVGLAGALATRETWDRAHRRATGSAAPTPARTPGATTEPDRA